LGLLVPKRLALLRRYSQAGVWGQPIDSDGIGGGSYKHWGAVFFGKLWLQDIQLQPEVVDTTSLFGDFGYTSGGAMIDVTCDSTQRGRMHYVNSGAGVADELEVCMKNIADTYAREAVTVTP
jgi:hypothetical protein